MSALVWLLVLVVPAAVVLPQLARVLGSRRGARAALAALLPWGGSWLALELHHASQPSFDRARADALPSEGCARCHEGHYASWHRTFHRTMTRDATPDTVKGDFAGTTFTYHGIASRMTREGDDFFMETADPSGSPRMTDGKPAAGPVPLKKFKVERLVGSHWFQECLTKDADGRYWRLPLSYHLVEGRWVHTNGAFLAPDTDDFWGKGAVWNETCLFCHNTRPVKWPLLRPGAPSGYRTEVAELGIACEACHGPGAVHARANQNPARRLAIRRAGGDPTITNPARLSRERSSQVCGHCHGSPAPRVEAWDRQTVADPFRAGDDLLRSATFFFSEKEQTALFARKPGRPFQDDPALRQPDPLDGRFWGDGTPLTTAVEYQGMALSACYENGRGNMSCLTCHQLHDSDPNFQLGPGMTTNEACLQCHANYRSRLTAHTHHAADSSGSLCYNCHMPYQVYSLLTGHRSHRIAVPRVKDSLGTGKPHACNLCHLDRPLAWTQDRLVQWYGHKPEPLDDEDRQFASSLVHLCQSDARSRAVVAHAFSWPAARQASGRDWPGQLLPRLLDEERYPAVRYLLHRGLRALYGAPLPKYDYLAQPAERGLHVTALRAWLDERCRPEAKTYPALPLTTDRRSDEAALRRLLEKRNDPDVFINE